MLQEATASLYNGQLDELPKAAATFARRPSRQLEPGHKQRDSESVRAVTPKKPIHQMQQSNVFSGDENPTFGSTNDIAKQTNFSAVKLLEQTRSISVQQTGGLPSIGRPLRQVNDQSATFDFMPYNRHFSMNIDNQTTNRNNQHFVSGYYQQLSDQKIIPTQINLAQKSQRALEFQSPMRSTSVVHAQTSVKKLLNDDSAEQTFLLTRRVQPLPLQDASRTIQATKLPDLFDSQFVTSLNNGIKVSARHKAAIIFGETERKHYRKEVTRELMGMPDYQSQSSARPYQQIGTLQMGADVELSSQNTETCLNSSAFSVLENNYSDFIQELDEEKLRLKRYRDKVREHLQPKDQQRFDEDEKFAQESIEHFRREEERLQVQEIREPERDVEKLKARIKLRSVKKYTEDQIAEQEQEKREQLARQSPSQDRLKSSQKPGDQTSHSHTQTTEEQSPKESAPKDQDEQSSEDLPIYGNSSDEELERQRRLAQEAAALAGQQVVLKKFDKTLVDLCPWQVENLMVFPHKAREGEIPLKLLIKHKVDYLVLTAKTLEEYQKSAKYQYSRETIQQIFDHYSKLFKLQPMRIVDFIVPCENERIKFSMRGVLISDNLAKALCCTVPFIYGIYEVEYASNSVTDIISPLLIMSAFANPSVRRYTYVNNASRTTFKRVFDELTKAWDMKFIEVNLSRSIPQLEILEKLSKSFSCNLFKLNISGNSLSINAARILNLFLLKQQYIKDLNLSRCRLSNQSARYIIDALNRNVTIRHLNMAHNDLASSIYEFCIKISSMLTRQPTLLHVDISQCNFKKEESMFIILAMSTSKNLYSLHMTGNELPYYERVFMRSLIAARVQFQNKDNINRQDIKMNRDRNQVMQLANNQHFMPEISEYLQIFNKLERERQGLDFEIEDLLKELNLEKHFEEQKGVQNIEDVPKESKLGLLIGKMIERNQELAQQQDQVKQMMKLTGPQIRQQLQQYGAVLNQTARMLEDNPDTDLQQLFAAKQELANERQRQRAELEATKQRKERSAGEMALLFMGINQVAFDLLIENPMTGYMNEIIFTRILGHDDIEQGAFWADTTFCYICHKWEKQVISYDPRHDDSKWSQKIVQVDKLQDTIENLYSQAQEVQLVHAGKDDAHDDQNVYKKKSTMNYQALGQSQEVGDQVQNQEEIAIVARTTTTKLGTELKGKDGFINVGPQMMQPKFGGPLGLTPQSNFVRSNKIKISDKPPSKYQVQSTIDGGVFSKALAIKPIGEEIQLERIDTPSENVDRPLKKEFNQENPLVPKKISIKAVQRGIFPEQFINANDFEELRLRHSNPGTPQDGHRPVMHANHDKYIKAKQLSRYGGPPGGMPGLTNKVGKRAAERQPSLKDITSQLIQQQQQKHSPRPVSHQSQQPSIMTTSVIQGDRRRGQPQKIQRTLFMGGMVYVIEEEVFSDSDNSSVYTSEDDFEVEQTMTSHYIAQTDDYQARLADEAEARRQALLNPVKTAKDLRLEKLGIVEEAKKELSQAQKEYKSKIWPKHYMPVKREEKAKNLDAVGIDLDIKVSKPNSHRHGKHEDNFIRSGPLPERPIIYLVGSFNDWMPVKLKTQRELTMEKINPDEPIPKSVFVLDNLIHLHANYMPPGKHYFYFVKEEGTIILSPKYQIVRFKSTNVLLNQVTVRPRVFDFDAVNVVRGGDDEQEIFLKDKSVFRDFKDDTKMYLRKCFDQDILYTKIQRTVKGEAEHTLEDIKELLFKHFVKINNIFLYYIGISTYPTIGLNDFTSWANKCDMVDGKWINLAALDRILITTNVALHGLINSAERDLNRYEFLEIIVRIAIAKYKDSGVCETTPLAVLKLLTDNIYPNSLEVNGDQFRRFQCYNVKVNEILQKNITVIKKIYDSYTHQKKKFIRLDECREYVLKAELKVSQQQTGVLFAESMMTLIDTIIDQTRPNQMKFVEFLVFLCRCAFEHYCGTPYENEMMYLKLEKLLPQMLAPLNLTPLFLFYEDFEYKPMQKKGKKQKKIEKLVASEQGSAQQSDDDDDDDSDEECTSEEDLGECVVLEEGKFKLSANYVTKMAREKEEREKRRQERLLAKQQRIEERAAAEEQRRLKKQELDLMSNGSDDN